MAEEQGDLEEEIEAPEAAPQPEEKPETFSELPPQPLRPHFPID